MEHKKTHNFHCEFKSERERIRTLDPFRLKSECSILCCVLIEIIGHKKTHNFHCES